MVRVGRPYGEPLMLLNCPLSCGFRIRGICSTGQHERGHLKRAHEAPDVLYCAYEAHGAQKAVLRGSETIEAVLPAVDACARSRHAGIYARHTQRHFSRSQDYKPLCKWTRHNDPPLTILERAIIRPIPFNKYLRSISVFSKNPD